MASARGELVISEAIKRALSLVTEAMDLLDAHGIAPESAANLAIAQQQLRQLVRS
jgi:hypothetical protein